MKQRILRTVRCHAKYLGGTMVEFTCPEGHVTREDINKGKPRHMHIGEQGARMLAQWWEKGHVNYHCPKCFQTKP